jgi:hypothetical protein
MRSLVRLVVLLAGAVTLDALSLEAEDGPPAPRSAGGTAPVASEPPAPGGVEPTRLFFAPTARSVPRGDGSFGLTELVFPWTEVGLLDRLSLRTIAVPPLEGLTEAGVVVGPKLQLVRSRHFQAAAGGFFAIGSGTGGGVGYGVVTIGGRDTSATVGVGYGYGEIAESGGSSAVVFAGAERSLGRRARLILEGYIGGDAFGLPEQTLIAGTRLNFGRWSVDVAAVVPFYETGSGGVFPAVTVGRAF